MLTILSAVWLLHVAAMVTPGANVLVVSQLAASDRTRSAVHAALGIATGEVMWSSATVLGVNAVFEAFPRFRIALQVASAIYLLYIATRLWHARALQFPEQSRSMSPVAAFRLGLLTNATNPKAVLFFGSVFSAALPAQPSTALLLSAVVLIVFNSLCWHVLLAHLFSHRRVRSAYSSQRRSLNRLAGSIAGALGLSLLAASIREARNGLPA